MVPGVVEGWGRLKLEETKKVSLVRVEAKVGLMVMEIRNPKTDEVGKKVKA